MGQPLAGSARIQEALQDIEAQLIALAKRVMPAQSIAILHALTNQWIDAHPDRTYVAFVRFSDLGNPERRRRFAEQHNARGLLAPVSQAARELEEIRGLSERALFLANHLPLLLEWQAESFVNNTLDLPQVKVLLDDTRRVSLAAENLGGDLSAAINEVGKILARERTQAILQLGKQFRDERTALFRDLESTSAHLLPLSESIGATALNLREAAQVVGEMRGAGTEGRFEIADMKEVLLGMTSLTEDTITLVESLRLLLNAETSVDAVGALDRLLRAHERRLFIYVAALILLAGIVVLGVALVRQRSPPDVTGAARLRHSRHCAI